MNTTDNICTRRAMMLGAAGSAAGAVTLLAGCSVYSDSASSGDAADPPAAAAAAAGGGSKALAKTSDIPVGGGKIFEAQGVVVTQPTAGTFKAFSTVCTHAGCSVNEIKDGTINCPCHGSKFTVADGAVDAGPAPRPLPSKKVVVKGDQVHLA